MTDVLTVGGIQFIGYAPPDIMTGGGRQSMVVHKLPGGGRVIDTLGPDDMPILWHGHFFDDNAYSMALALDGMRSQGAVVPLSWGGQFRSVIIEEFIYRVRRLPVWVEYAISCTVLRNPMAGSQGVGAGGTDSMINSDLATAADTANGNTAGQPLGGIQMQALGGVGSGTAGGAPTPNAPSGEVTIGPIQVQ